MTDHLTENARLRAALEESRTYALALEAELKARSALATPAPDAVQEAARVPEIAALIEAVEAGTFLMDVFDDGRTERIAYEAFGGSLDAAKSLHEALLGYDWGIASFSLNGEVSVKRNRPLDVQYGFADMEPARAWLLAVLRAKEVGQ